jgi:dTDP-4-amino-4,6-dideoxygalactose transaminase
MSIKIPFKKVYIPDGLLQAVRNSIETGKFDAVARLEDELVSKIGTEYALSTSTSTAALHLAMCALDLKRGDKVLCPVNSFVDLPEVVRHFDAEPVFVDTLPGSYVIDPEKLVQTAERVKGKKLRAVLVNHPGGKKAPMEEVRKVADEYGLKVIEDASDRLGGNDIGQHSDMAVVGFCSKTGNSIKGGALLTNDQEYHERAKLLSNHGIVYTSEETSYMYDVFDIGCQYRMSEYNALYCRALLADNDKIIARRKEIAQKYRDAFDIVENITIPEDDNDHTYTQFIVEIGTNRDAFARKLREKGIEVSVQYIPLNQTKYYKEKYGLKVFDFPSALDSYQKIMSLPIYSLLEDSEIDKISETIISIAKTHR